MRNLRDFLGESWDIKPPAALIRLYHNAYPIGERILDLRDPEDLLKIFERVKDVIPLSQYFNIAEYVKSRVIKTQVITETILNFFDLGRTSRQQLATIDARNLGERVGLMERGADLLIKRDMPTMDPVPFEVDGQTEDDLFEMEKLRLLKQQQVNLRDLIYGPDKKANTVLNLNERNNPRYPAIMAQHLSQLNYEDPGPNTTLLNDEDAVFVLIANLADNMRDYTSDPVKNFLAYQMFGLRAQPPGSDVVRTVRSEHQRRYWSRHIIGTVENFTRYSFVERTFFIMTTMYTTGSFFLHFTPQNPNYTADQNNSELFRNLFGIVWPRARDIMLGNDEWMETHGNQYITTTTTFGTLRIRLTDLMCQIDAVIMNMAVVIHIMQRTIDLIHRPDFQWFLKSGNFIEDVKQAFAGDQDVGDNKLGEIARRILKEAAPQNLTGDSWVFGTDFVQNEAFLPLMIICAQILTTVKMWAFKDLYTAEDDMSNFGVVVQDLKNTMPVFADFLLASTNFNRMVRIPGQPKWEFLFPAYIGDTREIDTDGVSFCDMIYRRVATIVKQFDEAGQVYQGNFQQYFLARHILFIVRRNPNKPLQTTRMDTGAVNPESGSPVRQVFSNYGVRHYTILVPIEGIYGSSARKKFYDPDYIKSQVIKQASELWSANAENYENVDENNDEDNAVDWLHGGYLTKVLVMPTRLATRDHVATVLMNAVRASSNYATARIEESNIFRNIRVRNRAKAKSVMELALFASTLDDFCLYEVIHQIDNLSLHHEWTSTKTKLSKRAERIRQDMLEDDDAGLIYIALTGDFPAFITYLRDNYPSVGYYFWELNAPVPDPAKEYTVVVKNLHAVLARTKTLIEKCSQRWQLEPPRQITDKASYNYFLDQSSYELKPKKPDVKKYEQEIDWSFDIETFTPKDSNRMIPYLIVLVKSTDRENPVVFAGENCKNDFINWLNEMGEDYGGRKHKGTRKPGNRIWGHNCFRFDWIFFMEELINTFPGLTMKGSSTKIRVLQICDNISCYDFINIFSGSLQANYSSFFPNSEVKKLDFDYDKIRSFEDFEEHREEATKYCINDCQMLLDLVLAHKEGAKRFHVSPYCISRPKYAFNIFRTNYLGKTVIKGAPQNIYPHIRESLRGGICRVWHKHFPVEMLEEYAISESNKGRYYDINSSYPASASDLVPTYAISKEPEVFELVWRREDKKKLDLLEPHTLYQVAMFSFKDSFLYPFFQMRYQNFDSLQYPRSHQVVDGVHWMWGIELNCAIAADALDSLGIVSKIRFKVDTIFKDFMKSMMELKIEGKMKKDKVLELNAKNNMNMLIGLFSLKNYPETHFCNKETLDLLLLKDTIEANIRYWCKLTDSIYYVENIATDGSQKIGSLAFIPSFITAKSRILLMNAIIYGTEKGTRPWVLYCDTDSIICNANFKLPPKMVHDTELGKFKLEYENITIAKLLAPKVYYLLGEEKGMIKEVMRAKGVYRNTLNREFFDELEENECVETELKNVFIRKFGYVTINNVNKVIKTY